MSTYLERKAALANNSTARGLWMVILGLQGLTALMALIALFGASALGFSFGILGSSFGFLFFFFGIIILAIDGLIFWGTYRLAAWVQWLMWLSVLFNLPNLFKSSGFFTALASILIALAYTWIRKQVETPTSNSIPQAPTTPVQTPPTV